MLLLKEYPESFHIARGCTHGNNSRPISSWDPFIHRSYLQATQVAFQEAVACAKVTSLVVSACSIFSSWADSWCQVLEIEMDRVLNALSDEESEIDSAAEEFGPATILFDSDVDY